MTHCYSIQIFYEDTDAAGIVYHANYLNFMERARSILFDQKGLSLTTLIDNFGVQFLVKELKITYIKPARLGQMVNVVTNIKKVGRASMVFEQKVYFDPSDPQTMICSGEVVIVCTNMQFKPCGIPAAVIGELTS